MCGVLCGWGGGSVFVLCGCGVDVVVMCGVWYGCGVVVVMYGVLCGGAGGVVVMCVVFCGWGVGGGW